MTDNRGMSRCAAFKCINNSYNSKLSFFRFPKDLNRSKIWITACNREDLMEKLGVIHQSSYRLCAIHFTGTMFANDARNRLRREAIPSIFPAQEKSSMNTIDEFIVFNEFDKHETITSQQSPSSSDNDSEELLTLPSQTKDKATILKKGGSIVFSSIHQQCSVKKEDKSENFLENVTLDDYKQLTYKFCPTRDLANFINALLCEEIVQYNGNRYSDDFHNYCLTLYFNDPKLYKNQLVKNFCLPSVAALQNFVKHFTISAGMNEMVFDMLKRKVEHFQSLDKLCVLCYDVISIKASLFYATDSDKIIGFEDLGDKNKKFIPALKATVLMVKGLHTNWKQPVAYYLSNSTYPAGKLKDIILNMISKLNDINLKIVGVVCDMRSNNIMLSKLLNVSSKSPYFVHNNHKIAFLFDAPYLLSSLRNNIMKYRFVVNGNIVSWEFIEKFYEHDKEFEIRAAPKLTHSHIYLHNFEKVNVKYAAQIFSNTVSRSLNLYIRFGTLPTDAKATQEFITLINNLFDTLNSSSVVNPTEFQKAYKGTDEQNKFLADCYNLFNNMKILDCKENNITKRIKCIEGWKITINGLIHLWNHLKINGMQFLFTKTLNLHCLEKNVKSMHPDGNHIKLSAIQFTRLFKKRFYLDMLHSIPENCEINENEILFKVANLPKIQIKQEVDIIVPDIIFDKDYQNCDILQTNFPKYICSYLIKKCYSKHLCETCETYAKDNEFDDTSLMYYFKAYNNIAFDNLLRPNENFVDFVTSMEILFQNNFKYLSLKDDIIKEIMKLFSTIKFYHPCTSFPYLYIVNLYARIRIYYTLKSINTNFKLNNKNRKLIIWRCT